MSPSLWTPFLVLVLCVRLQLVDSVDKSNFKTCEQSSFCRRHRDQKESENKWTLATDSVSSTEDGYAIEANLKEEISGVLLHLKLTSALEDGSVLRVHINEQNAERGRYEATDALLPDLKFSNISLQETNDQGFTATFGAHGKAVVHASPFKIDIFINDHLTMIVNQKQLMKFEDFRHKTESDKNDHGEWEETFKTHTDSKPYGPMSVGLDVSFVDFQHLYGLPEHADSFSLRNTKGTSDPYRLYNLDVFEYETNSLAALYGSIPMVIAHSPERTVGFVWLNPSETWVDIESSTLGSGILTNFVGGEAKGRTTHWISETGVIDMWFLTGPSPSDVVLQNAKLSGTTQLPPYYAIGYHQCRWNYYTQEEVAGIDSQFDNHDIPLDAIWLDIEYTEGRSKKYFTWDPVAFSDYKTLISNLTSKGRRLITIIDPHIKRDTGYAVYNEGIEKGLFIKNKDDSVYDGWCWPGSSSWPDYVDPAVREWWAKKFDPEYFPGFKEGLVDIWNDMNEPSIFNGPEITAPKDLVHYQGWEHRDVHNIYGQLMTRATFEGLRKYRPNTRSFILTRAFFWGSQRYCAAWTGDNMAKFDHLKMTIPMILSQSIVGMTFVGADVPGFFFNPEPELVARWYQAATFQPFVRGHGHTDTKHREPWLFDDNIKEIIRNAIQTRYSYLPYMYTLFYENSISGLPINRPLWFQFPEDLHTFDIDESFLLGDALLVHPVMDKDIAILDVYFPGSESDQWIDPLTNKPFSGGSTVKLPVSLDSNPYFQRSGTIIPRRKRSRRSAALTLDDPITLEIVLDKDGYAKGKLYLDDGHSLDYSRGQFLLTGFEFSHGHLRNTPIEGELKSNVWIERVVIRRIGWKPAKAKVSHGSSTTQLAFKMPNEDVVIIRKPGVKVSDPWTLTIG